MCQLTEYFSFLQKNYIKQGDLLHSPAVSLSERSLFTLAHEGQTINNAELIGISGNTKSARVGESVFVCV